MVTIKQFQDARKYKDDFFKAYAILKGISEDKAKLMPISQINKKANWVASVITPDKTKGMYVKWYRVGFRFYKVPYTVAELTSEQYIALTTLVDKGVEDNLHLIITSMIYKGKNPKKFAERLQKKANYRLAFGMAVFFSLYWKALKNSVLISSSLRMQEVGSKNIGDGK
jgi:hypothetical protein